MKYDFTTVMDRHGLDAMAVDALGTTPGFSPDPPREGFDVIPMWVADMNFPTVPTVPQAIIRRVQHPAYGYFLTSREYYDTIINWHRERHGVEGMEPKHIGYENGVLGGVISALNVFCPRGDKVLVHSPTYVGFTNSLTNCGYKIIYSPLVLDEAGIWRMDFADMEKKLARGDISAAIFCSPHNPCGRVWERWELERAMELFAKYDVSVISDEIWSDLVLPGYKHIPTQTISPDAKMRTVALYAPSKTFNLAGLVGSYHVVYNDRLRARLEKESSLSHYNAMNVLSMHACAAAYGPEGSEWVDELCQVLEGNIDRALSFIKGHFPGVEAARPQGTYMLFLDCTGWCEAQGKTIDQVLKAGWDVGVAWQDGRPFHGPCHIRVNLALPLSRVEEALRRMEKYIFCEGV